MTFSIIGRSPDGQELGVAVASKFLAVGAYVPAAAANAGALATQALGNVTLRTTGLDLLRSGLSATDMLKKFFADDPQKDHRQVGVIDADGGVVTYTGVKCLPWAGGRAEAGPHGAYAAQGNMLAGPQVIDAMVDAWQVSSATDALAKRLIAALAAGQVAGGDPRGQQAAAILVVRKGAGYGGLSDVAVDLRSDDSPAPIAELQRMLRLHELYFGITPFEQLLPLSNNLLAEVDTLLAHAGYTSGDTLKNLYNWMGRENFEERWYDDKIDPVVLEQLHLKNTK